MKSAAWSIIVSALAGVCEQGNEQRPSLINFQVIEIDVMCGHGNGLQAKKSDIGRQAIPPGALPIAATPNPRIVTLFWFPREKLAC
jgi:hypothetical protein